MSNARQEPFYRDSASSSYFRWLIERVLEDRAESAPLPPDDDDE
jgi:hypothetical protein